MTSFMCPFGLAFDNNSGKCKDASVIQCVQTTKEKTFDFTSTIETDESNKTDKYTLIKHLKERLSKEGFLFIGKYFSTKVNTSYNSEVTNGIRKVTFNHVKQLNRHTHSKSKRSVYSYKSSVQDLMFQYKLTNILVLPLVSEIMQDSVSKAGLQSILLSARSAYMPIYYKVHHRSKDVILQITQKDIDEANNDFFQESGPIARKIVDRHLFQILRRLSGNIPIVLEMIDRLELSSRYQVEKWKSNMILFFRIHGEVVRTSSSDVSSSTEGAVRRDFRVVETPFVQFFSKLIEQSPVSFMRLIYDRNSVMYRAIMGENFQI